MMGAERASNGRGVCQAAPVSGFLLRSAVCLLECPLFWMHSIEDTNCIIHGRQAGNGEDEWWPLFLSWQRRSGEELYTITHKFVFDQWIATGEVLTVRWRPEELEFRRRRAPLPHRDFRVWSAALLNEFAFAKLDSELRSQGKCAIFLSLAIDFFC